MKIVAIGDIHGRDSWKEIIKNESDFDLVVFIGDYLDSFDISIEDQNKNFSEILKFQQENVGKVILILGNHDYHYMEGVDEKYSGYKPIQKLHWGNVLKQLYEDGHIVRTYTHGGITFSHAGLTKTFVENYDGTLQGLGYNKFDTSGYGNLKYQSHLWVRPGALLDDKCDGIQVVGHTTCMLTENQGVFFIDSLMYDQYLLIKDGVFITKDI